MFELPAEQFCLNCMQRTLPTSQSPGSFLGELGVWALSFILASATGIWLLLIAALVYTCYRALNKRKVCHHCKSTNLIPIDSPRAQQELNKQQTP